MKRYGTGFGVGLIIGGIVAGTTALLLTEKTGTERQRELDYLREDILAKVDYTKDTIKTKIGK